MILVAGAMVTAYVRSRTALAETLIRPMVPGRTARGRIYSIAVCVAFDLRCRPAVRRTLGSVSVPFDFDEVFDADYLFFYEPLLADVTEADVDAIWRLLKLEPDMAVLDLACGHGRIANRLAERGARVTALDATALFLDRARRDAASRGVDVNYVEGDMRVLPWTDERFDRVVSWFTSFGYFDDTDNRRVLQEVHRVLRPDGRLLIENNNLVELLPRWQPALVTERNGHFAIDRSCFKPAH
jgi:SAM-dependent methyltransferase